MVYKVNGEVVTKEEWEMHKPPGWQPIQCGTPDNPGKAPGLHGAQSFDQFVSPVDGSVIDSKHKLREHNRKHGVVQVGDDYLNKGNNGKTREESIKQQNKGQQ